ncbi:TadE family protein [Georgenia sp. H159]|uniref:TadE family protein n=1 Tax=Georgenia sp. H159 TaxID=3076115 RepID=UPI002D76DF1A|nr:TadE family protein [Georgenia sp. H159]
MTPVRPATGRHRRLGERGSVSIELVVLLPALFAIVLLGVQGALYYHAHTVAIAAAQEGARAAGAKDSTAGAGIAAATDFVTDIGRHAITDVSVGGERGDTVARVTVTGTSISILPGFAPQITARAEAPVEKATAP